MAATDSIQIYIDGVAITQGKRRLTGKQLGELVEPHAENVWLDLDDAQDHPVATDEILRLEDDMRFYTDRSRSIFIDKVEYQVRSAFITEDQLRRVPKPPIPDDSGIWRDVVDELDDRIQAKGGSATLAPMDVTNR